MGHRKLLELLVLSMLAVVMFALSRDAASSVPLVLAIVFALAALVFGGLR